MNEQELFDLKEEIEEAKQLLASLTGQEKMVLENLKKQFDCKSLQEAENLLRKKEEEIGKLKKEIEVKLEKLEEDYGAIS